MSRRSPLGATLDALGACFEGMIPATICSCSANGIPNVTYLSIVHRVDDRHVALSYQFFNKTRQNVLENPLVQVLVVSPETGDQFRLDLQYERTEEEGPIFNRMSAGLAAVASQTGMSQIFKLRGADVYRVLDCRPANAEIRSEVGPSPEHLAAIEAVTGPLAACEDLDSLVETALESVSTLFECRHLFMMVPDVDGARLYTIASRGYDASGVGSEVRKGDGILGVVAERRTIVRTTALSRELRLARAVRSSIERQGHDHLLDREIALPGLPRIESQMVAPLVAHGQLVGIVCLQSAEIGWFRDADERIMQIVARHFAASLTALRSRFPAEPCVMADPRQANVAGTSNIIHYQSDDSIFVDDAYVIKGVAGRILWKLLRSYELEGRRQFTNREMRLDASLQLPDIKDNLETRLILLRRRLDDRCDVVRLVPDGRGRLRLDVRRRLMLSERP